MTDAFLSRSRTLAEGCAQFIRKEKRVIAEPFNTARVTHDDAAGFTTHDRFARAIVIRRGAHVPGDGSLHVPKCLQQPDVVRVVQFLPGQVMATRPSLASHPGTSLQRHDLEP